MYVHDKIYKDVNKNETGKIDIMYVYDKMYKDVN